MASSPHGARTPFAHTTARGSRTLVIACGALSHELVWLKRANQWQHIDIQCLPAEWHNTPQRITPAIERKIAEYQHHYRQIFVAYADCGTGGALDRLLQAHAIERLPGDHCYSFFAGRAVFDSMASAELGTFYLTDYLAEHFERLIMDGLGITRHPQLLQDYFGHYTRLMYLQQDSQGPRASVRLARARKASESLGLKLEIHHTGLQPFQDALSVIPIASVH